MILKKKEGINIFLFQLCLICSDIKITAILFYVIDLTIHYFVCEFQNEKRHDSKRGVGILHGLGTDNSPLDQKKGVDGVQYLWERCDQDKV